MNALLSTFGIDWHALLAHIANFAILVVALTWLLYKPVLKMVKEREQVIAKGVEDAQAAADKLAHADGEATKVVATADQKADEIVKTARKNASDERVRMLAEADDRAAQIEKDAQARASETAARSKRESEKEIARLAILAAEKVLKEKA